MQQNWCKGKLPELNHHRLACGFSRHFLNLHGARLSTNDISDCEKQRGIRSGQGFSPNRNSHECGRGLENWPGRSSRHLFCGRRLRSSSLSRIREIAKAQDRAKLRHLDQHGILIPQLACTFPTSQPLEGIRRAHRPPSAAHQVAELERLPASRGKTDLRL